MARRRAGARSRCPLPRPRPAQRDRPRVLDDVPGDRVRVLAVREGGLWRAQDIEVLADVRQGGGYGEGNGGMERRGAISRVVPLARSIAISAKRSASKPGRFIAR